jgi:hypothetical protein
MAGDAILALFYLTGTTLESTLIGTQLKDILGKLAAAFRERATPGT